MKIERDPSMRFALFSHIKTRKDVLIMAIIKKYIKKDGSTAYQFNAYLGVDPLTGKKKRTTRRGFKTSKEARLALARLQLEVDTQGFVKQNFTTFEAVYELWYSSYVNTVKPITADNTERMFRLHILPIFGNYRINKITKVMCQNAVNKWAAELAAFRLVKSVCNKLFNYTVSQDIISQNPMQFVVMPKKMDIVESDRKIFMDSKELQDLLSDAKTKLAMHDYLILRVLSFTGMRKGELYPLKWSDVDLTNKTISINKTMTIVNKRYIVSTPKTKSSNRVISLDDRTINELIVWKRKQKEELLKYGRRTLAETKQLVFHKKNNELLDSAYINRLLKNKLDTMLSPHSLRHTHASLLFESGASIKDVQKRLGHTNVKVTLDIYTHVTKDADDKVLKMLNQKFNF
jgi:integrase